jgi:phage-related tail fiber protein
METEPVGWLECDGAAVSRTTYTNLYAVTGDLHGEGDGSTTFNVPDLRGRFARGWDHTAGNDPDAASRTAPATGGSAGDMVGSVQDDAYESHTHTYSLVDEGYGSGGGPDFGAGNDKDYDGTVTTGDPDSAMGSETRPKNLYMMYCIKY